MSSWRSVLYVPADKPRALEKAAGLAADALVLDLEDAVAPGAKAEARQAAARFLADRRFPGPVLVRLNTPETPHFQADLEMALTAAPAGIVLPKSEQAAVIRDLHLGIPLWLMIETPLGVLNAPELSRVPGVAGLMAGANDLALGLRARPGRDRQPLLYALSAVVLAARAHGLLTLDAVWNDLKDPEGFLVSCVQGRDLGFDGRTLIHPSQLEGANRVYGVSDEEAQAARALLERWEAAAAQGQGVVSHQGQMIEELHARQARELLERWQVEQRQI
ncbi:CoA ester lyase [Deinococcus sonorensis]|uniref:CoA ester lyase n=2 Tax=Deinococcus sonorensis TaxID=309891 RepID=A0AAU7U8H5_9DEIO